MYLWLDYAGFWKSWRILRSVEWWKPRFLERSFRKKWVQWRKPEEFCFKKTGLSLFGVRVWWRRNVERTNHKDLWLIGSAGLTWEQIQTCFYFLVEHSLSLALWPILLFVQWIRLSAWEILIECLLYPLTEPNHWNASWPHGMYIKWERGT